MSGTDCTYCQSVRELVAGIHDPGNHGTGGAYELGFAGVSALGGDRFVVGIEYVETPPSRTVAPPDGSIVEDFPDTYSMQAQIELSWSDGKWTVDGVQVDEWGRQRMTHEQSVRLPPGGARRAGGRSWQATKQC